MSLILDNRLVSRTADLSQPCLLVLSLIDGGFEWLRHAIDTPASAYRFRDELALVVAAQQGLHGTPLVLLPNLGLMAGAARLIALPADKLRLLAKVEASGAAPDELHLTHLRLSDEGLVTASELAGADALLKSLGVAGAPLFQALSLADRLVLLERRAELAADGAPSAAAQKAAARFAAEFAYTPPEFADYHRIWLALATGPDPLDDDRIRGMMATLLPLLFDALDCPQVPGLVAPAEVAGAVAAWMAAGRRVGFPRLSRAARQLVVHGGYRGETGSAGRALVDRHLALAHAFLAGATLSRARISQDGGTAAYRMRVAGRPGEAELHLEANGAITLHRWVPTSPEPVQEES